MWAPRHDHNHYSKQSKQEKVWRAEGGGGTLWQSFQDLSSTVPRGLSGAPEDGLIGTLSSGTTEVVFAASSPWNNKGAEGERWRGRALCQHRGPYRSCV